jgi:oxygen-independent coproporphyrinogen III oxidase
MPAAVTFDADLVRRYDRPGPRYTSYPTAPHFDEAFGEARFCDHVRRSNEELIPRRLSLYVHVPYCFSPCFYCGCNRVITRDPRKGERYVERLLREIQRVSPLFDRDRDVVQLHFGGGTPNFLPPAQLGRLLESLDRHFHFSSDAARDFSIEIDPRCSSAADVAELGRLGFDRASLGVQDFDPAVQRAVNREQSVQQTLEVIDACRAAGMRSVNVDLIYGLPRQTIAGFDRTLRTVIDARPDRLAIYGYAHLPATFKPQRQISEGDLPDAELRLQLLRTAVARLEEAGYTHIGLDHFALPEDDLAVARDEGGLHRNFMGYTTHADCDLLGLGVSAISHIGDSFSQNHRGLPDWELAIDQDRLPIWRGLDLTFDDVLRADVIQQLMCRGEIDVAATERRFQVNFGDYFHDCLPQLRRLADDGLLTLTTARVSATSRGRYLLRIIAMCFDRYLHVSRPAPDGIRYSKAL